MRTQQSLVSVLCLCNALNAVANGAKVAKYQRSTAYDSLVPVSDVKHMVYIQNVNDEIVNADLAPEYCNGALIQFDWVLTSASCVIYAATTDLLVFGNATSIGDSHGVHTSVRRVYKSKYYESTRMYSNIALLRLDDRLEGTNVQYASLNTVRRLRDYHPLYAYSYGFNGAMLGYFDQLKSKKFAILQRNICTVLCAKVVIHHASKCGYFGYGDNSIVYDVGGPVMHREFIVGIITGSCESSAEGSPSIFTVIKQFVKHIRRRIMFPDSKSAIFMFQ